MATLAAQPIGATGLAPTLVAAAAGGDHAAPAEHQFLIVKNGDSGSHVVTLVVPGTEYGQNRADVAITVAAGATKYVQLPPELIDPTTGLVGWTYDGVTSVTVGVCRV